MVKPSAAKAIHRVDDMPHQLVSGSGRPPAVHLGATPTPEGCPRHEARANIWGRQPVALAARTSTIVTKSSAWLPGSAA